MYDGEKIGDSVFFGDKICSTTVCYVGTKHIVTRWSKEGKWIEVNVCAYTCAGNILFDGNLKFIAFHNNLIK